MTDVLGDDTEFTELVDADVPRVDLVERPANGSGGFLLMKQDANAGLLDPAFVRELVGKPEPVEKTSEEQVTMSGSPGAIARLIHEAAQRQVAKAKYDTDDRKHMAGHEAMDDGSYPIADREDLENAIHAVGRGGANHDAIRRHIETRARALGATSMIPDNWAADGSLTKESAVADDVDMDPMTIMAEPDSGTPGNPTTPGSPAWEAIDAATARKWTGILARARAAVDLLSDREMMEAASGADPDDAGQAYDLQDACCAIDYAISVLAPFAVSEQAEADCGEEMAAVGKALADFDPAELDTIEALGIVAKAGRVLSTANEAAIRGAVESLQKVLASLPQAPTTEEESGRPVAKEASEETGMPHTEPSADAVTDAGETPTMDTPDVVGKADGEKEMVAVYDKNGNLVGICDPEKITRIAGAESDDDSGSKDDAPADDGGTSDAAGEAAPETPDLEPAPAGEVGTPADAAPSDDDVTKSDNEQQSNTTSEEVLKSSLLAAVEEVVKTHSAAHTEQIAKTGDAVLELAEMVETLKGRLQVLEEQPAEPKVFTNGAVPPREMLRGQDRGAPASVDVAKAQQMKKGLYGAADATEQNRIATDMQTAAIEALQAIHQRRAQ
jgi:hypothetical protein